MRGSSIVRWSGGAAILGGMLLIGVCLVVAAQPVGCIAAECTAGRTMRTVGAMQPVLMTALVVAALLIAVSFAGLVLRSWTTGRFGRVGRSGLVLSGLGALLLTVVPLAAWWSDELPPVFVIPGGLALIGGLLLVTLELFRARTLPQWTLACLCLGVLMLLSFNDQNARVLLAIPVALAWLGVGYVLWTDTGSPRHGENDQYAFRPHAPTHFSHATSRPAATAPSMLVGTRAGLVPSRPSLGAPVEGTTVVPLAADVPGSYQQRVPTDGQGLRLERVREQRLSSFRLVRWGGVSAMLAGLLWFVVRVLVLWSPPPLTYDAYNRLFTVPLLLFVGGLVGLLAVDCGNGWLARGGHRLAFLGCALLLSGNVLEFWLVLVQAQPTAATAYAEGGGEVWLGSPIGWMVFLLGLFVLCLGLVLWGLAVVRVQSFPRWRYIPLVMGGHGLLAFVVAPFLLPATDFLLLLFGLEWIWLGAALWSHATTMTD